MSTQPVQPQTKVKPFNELAKDFDPMMPADQYDQLRGRYFESYVKPNIKSGLSVNATREQFMKMTERAPLLNNPRLAQAGLAAAAASKQLLEPLKNHSEQASHLFYKAQDTEKDLTSALQRDGHSTVVPDVAGNLVGTGVAFGAVTAATDGVGDVAGVPELLKGVGEASRALETAQKVSKGALAFGTYETLVANKKDRGYAFVKGAAEGAAFEGTFSLAGKLFSKGKVKPEDIEKEVANTLQSEPDKAINPEVDKVVAKHIQEGQQTAIQQGRPLLVKPDPSSRKIKILGADKDGRPFTVQVEPYAEGKALDAVKQHTQNGGEVQMVTYHPEEMASFNKFASMAEQTNTFSTGEARTVTTPKGKAPKVAAAMHDEGIEAEAQGDSRVAVNVPKKGPPSLGDLTQAMGDHTLPDGTKFSKGEVWDTAKKIQQLQSNAVPPSSKEVIANQLAGQGLEKYIPLRWQRTVEQTQEASPATDVVEDLKAEQPSEIQQVMNQEIESKGRNVSPIAGLEGTMKDGQAQLASGFHVEEPLVTNQDKFAHASRMYDQDHSVDDVSKEMGVTYAKAKSYYNKWSKANEEVRRPFNKLNVPPSEQFSIEHTKAGARLTKNESVQVSESRRKMNVKVSGQQMQDLMGDNTRGFMTSGQGESYTDILHQLGIDVKGLAHSDKPTMVYQDLDKDVIYHEGLHNLISIQAPKERIMSIIPDLMTENAKTADSLQKGLGKTEYRDMDDWNRIEEAFVNTATALRYNDFETLNHLGRIDTSTSAVVKMADDMAYNFLERSSEVLDTDANREFQNKMRDILNRTGEDRWERWTNAANRAGYDLHYNGDTDEFILSDSGQGTQTRYKETQDIVDAFDHNQGASYLPSESLAFEYRGLRHPLVPLGSEIYHEREMPMPERQHPEKERFKGIGAASSLFRPTMDWAASMDKKFGEVYKGSATKVPFFERFKAVDDAVRSGENWKEQNYEEAAEFLRGDSNRLKTMFNFVTQDPKYWDRMKTRFNVNDDFIKDATKAQQWLSKFRDETGIQVHNYLKTELKNLQGFNYELGMVYGRNIKDLKEMSFFHKAITTGELNPRDEHLGRFVNFLLRSGYEKKFTGPALDGLKDLIDMQDKNGMSILGTLRFPVQNYIDYVKGIPDASQQIMNKTVGDFQKILGDTFKQINKRLPGKYKLPEEFNYPGAVVNKLMNLSYVAGIGLRPIIPIRDALQVMTNTLPILGPKKFLSGMQKALSVEGFDEASRAGALLTKHNIGDLYGDIFQEIPPHSGSTLDKAMGTANKLLAPSRWGHNVGRAIAYHGEFDAAVKAIAQYRAGGISVRKLFEDTSMWFFPKALQTHLMKDVLNSSVEVEEVAKKLALETVDHTLWPYRRGTQPLALRTGIGRIFGQYGLWPLNYMEFLKRGASKYAEYPHKMMQTTGLWLGTNYAASKALSSMGADVGKWFFLSPSGYTGSAQMQLALDLMKAPEDSQDGREARKRVLQYPLNFVPASLEIRAVLKSLNDGGDMFDGNGKPTPDLIRVLGMKPQKPHMQDLTPEEWMQYETGFKERR